MKQLFETYKPEEMVQSRRILNTPSDFAKRALFYVQETGYLKSLRSHLSQRSDLNSFLFLIVLSGRGTFTYQEQNYRLGPSDCILINCMNSYAHNSDETHPWELLWVHFNGPAAGDYYQYYINTCNNVFHAENPEEYVSLINQLISTSQKKEASWELISSRLITDLLTTCIVNSSQQLSSGSSLIINKLYKIKDYLDQNYGQKLLLEDLANKFYISKFHLCREYKKLFGITVNDSITLKRITNAKELLRFTKMSIENIATESGYPDASYFNKVFQKVEGMSASDYRKKW